MLQAEQLPPPNVKYLSEKEKADVTAHILELMDAHDMSGVAKMAEIYPLSARSLDGIKKYYGMDFLLENRFNLANAVKDFGEDWLKS